MTFWKLLELRESIRMNIVHRVLSFPPDADCRRFLRRRLGLKSARRVIVDNELDV